MTEKIEVGNTVKVINSTIFNGHATQLIPIGTICHVSVIDGNSIGLIPIFSTRRQEPYFYLTDEVKKGQLIWKPIWKSDHKFE